MLDQHLVVVQVSEVVWSLQGVAVAHSLVVAVAHSLVVVAHSLVVVVAHNPEEVVGRMTVVVVGFGIDTRVVDCVPGSLVVRTIVDFVQAVFVVAAVLLEVGLPFIFPNLVPNVT